MAASNKVQTRGLARFRPLVQMLVMGFLLAPTAAFADIGYTRTDQAAELQSITAANRANSKVNWFRESIMPGGPYEGDPLDTSMARPVRILNGASLPGIQEAAPGELVLGNIYHAGSFWIARVRPEQAKKSYLQLSMFMPIAAHTMVRFQFDRPVELVARLEDTDTDVRIHPLEKPILLNDLILSIESTWSAARGDRSYDLVSSLRGIYVNTFRMISIQERAAIYSESKIKVQQYELHLTPAEVARTFTEAALSSHRFEQTIMYHLLKRNCTNLAIQIIERSVGYADRDGTVLEKRMAYVNWLYDKFVKIDKVYPIIATYGLWARGFLASGSTRPNLEVDPSSLDYFQFEENRMRAFKPKEIK